MRNQKSLENCLLGDAVCFTLPNSLLLSQLALHKPANCHTIINILQRWKQSHPCVQAPGHKDIRGVNTKPFTFLTSTPTGNLWSASCSSPATPTIPWIGCWVGSRPCLGSLVRRNAPAPAGNWTVGF